MAEVRANVTFVCEVKGVERLVHAGGHVRRQGPDREGSGGALRDTCRGAEGPFACGPANGMSSPEGARGFVHFPRAPTN
jgi:hypothetical protein